MAYPQELPLAQLALASNYRTTFIPQEIAEMVISCRALVDGKPRGIIEPLIVRPMKKAGVFQIVCGGKRFRAATEAELPSVPVRVVEMADEDVVEFQLIENLMRSNPHPMQEAEGFSALLAMHKDWNADHLAERVGRDRSYIYKRLQFMELIKPAAAAFREDRISIGHALELSRLPQSKQPEGFGQCFETRWDHKRRERVADPKKMQGRATQSVGDLRNWIREHILCELSAAPWDKSDATLVPKAGACITCPKHTGANTALFEDLAQKGDKCLDRDCFEQKRQAFVDISIKAAPEMPRITLGYEVPPKGIIARSGNGYQLVEKSQQGKCKSAQPAIVASGDKQLGHKVLICLDRDCPVHGTASGTQPRYGYNNKTPQEVAAEKRKRLEQKVREASQRAILKAIAETDGALISEDGILFVCDRVIERIGHDNRRELCAALGLEGIKRKQYNRSDFEKPLNDWIRADGAPEAISFLLAALACNAFYARPYGSEPGRLNQAAKCAGVNAGKLHVAAGKPIREKAAKAKENAAKKKAKAKKTAKSPEAAAFEKLVPAARNAKFHAAVGKRIDKALAAQAAKS